MCAACLRLTKVWIKKYFLIFQFCKGIDYRPNDVNFLHLVIVLPLLVAHGGSRCRSEVINEIFTVITLNSYIF